MVTACGGPRIAATLLPTRPRKPSWRAGGVLGPIPNLQQIVLSSESADEAVRLESMRQPEMNGCQALLTMTQAGIDPPGVWRALSTETSMDASKIELALDTTVTYYGQAAQAFVPCPRRHLLISLLEAGGRPLKPSYLSRSIHSALSYDRALLAHGHPHTRPDRPSCPTNNLREKVLGFT